MILLASEKDLIKRLTTRLPKDSVQIESLPEADGNELVRRTNVKAPGVFIVAQPFSIIGDKMVLPFNLICVVKNAAGKEEARQGDGIALGLYALMIMVISTLHHSSVFSPDSFAWQVLRGGYLFDEGLLKNGLSCGLVSVQTSVAVPEGEQLDEEVYPFLHFHADYDIPPHVSKAEHEKWLKDNPDHSNSSPDLQGETRFPDPDA